MAADAARYVAFFRAFMPWYTIVIQCVLSVVGIVIIAWFILPMMAESMVIGSLVNVALLKGCVKGKKVRLANLFHSCRRDAINCVAYGCYE